jgi:hypothetical protein
MADMRIHNTFMARRRPDYVKSGLKLWLDGILNTRNGHDATATGWQDISGSNFDFVPYTSGKSPTIGENHYTGFAADTFLKCANTTLKGYSDSTHAGTLEAVFTAPGNYGQVIGFRNVSGGNMLAKLIVAYGTSSVTTTPTLIVAGKYSGLRYNISQSVQTGIITNVSVTYTASSVITPKVNGMTVSTVEQTTGWGNNGGDVHVGARVHTNSTNYYPFGGRIYCIRYYNRILTAAEQAHNRAIDIRRFGAYNG